MVIGILIHVVHSLIAAKAACDRLNQGGLVVAVALVRKEASALQYDLGHYGIGSRAADIGIGVTGVVSGLKAQCGLDKDKVSNIPLVGDVFAHLKYLRTEFVSHHYGVFSYVIGYALMSSALLICFVGRRAQ